MTIYHSYPRFYSNSRRRARRRNYDDYERYSNDPSRIKRSQVSAQYEGREFPVDVYLEFAAASFREKGWVKNNWVYEDLGLDKPTWWDALDRMEAHEPTALPDSLYAREAIETLRDLENTEYNAKLGLLLKRETVTVVDLPMLASAVIALKVKKDQRKEAEQKKQSRHIGTVGEKVELRNMRLIFKKEISSVFGLTNLYKFDIDGSTAVMFTKNELPEGEPKIYRGLFKIDEHSEYLGAKETKIKFANRKGFQLDHVCINCQQPFAACTCIAVSDRVPVELLGEFDITFDDGQDDIAA